jgi:tRNA-splicing ligase RtcB (3'-phosphate/5'-hydroxy nucleic acid ligase)
MIHGGYLVCGKGVAESLNSAAHGAGRAMSRRRAKESFSGSDLRKTISNAGVTLIGGSTEEAPLAYKNIDEVMRAQEQLVDIHGKFIPKVVRMNKE